MNPLDQLAPNVLPPEIAFWPPAIGWWLSLFIILGSLLVWFIWRRLKGQSDDKRDPYDIIRHAAIKELRRQPKPIDQESIGPWLQSINALLKRLCQYGHPNDGSQPLSGKAWLSYLDKRCPRAQLSRWVILSEGLYRPDGRMSPAAIDGLEAAVTDWILHHV